MRRTIICLLYIIIIQGLFGQQDFTFTTQQPFQKDIMLQNAFDEYYSNRSEEEALETVKLESQYGTTWFHKQETTLLLETVQENYFSCVEYVLKQEDFLEEINDNYVHYAPPLFFALQNGNSKISELLLSYGADTNFRTVENTTAFECLDEFLEDKTINDVQYEELRQLLLDYGYEKEFPCSFKIGDKLTVKENLRLRDAANLSGKVITTLKTGCSVKVLNLGKYENIDELNNRWIKIEVLENSTDTEKSSTNMETIGWCYGGYLK